MRQCAAGELKKRVAAGSAEAAEAPDLPNNQHAIAEGFAFKSREPYRKSRGPGADALEFTPQIWMTIRDILPAVALTQDHRRLQGCCGLEGCNGPNRVCACGSHVGTEISDCWTSFLCIPDPKTTYWSL